LILGAAALFVLFTAPARARIVSPGLGLGPTEGPGLDALGVEEFPLPVFFFEEALFDVFFVFIVLSVVSAENQSSLFVVFFAGFGLKNLEAKPL
jgi:hypothetical protein